jgi:hypothetical protein
MNTKIAAAALAALLASVPAAAAETKSAPAAPAAPAPAAPAARRSIMTFFQHLREALEESAVSHERKHTRFGNVAAVRGADQSSSLSDPDRTTLKGDAATRRERRGLAEDAEIKAAVDLILAGKTAKGIEALEAFKTAHPKSRRLPKVDEALAQAKQLEAEGSKGEKVQ